MLHISDDARFGLQDFGTRYNGISNHVSTETHTYYEECDLSKKWAGELQKILT